MHVNHTLNSLMKIQRHMFSANSTGPHIWFSHIYASRVFSDVHLLSKEIMDCVDLKNIVQTS